MEHGYSVVRLNSRGKKSRGNAAIEIPLHSPINIQICKREFHVSLESLRHCNPLASLSGVKLISYVHEAVDAEHPIHLDLHVENDGMMFDFASIGLHGLMEFNEATV